MGVIAGALGYGNAGQTAGSAMSWAENAGVANAAAQAFQGFGGYQQASYAADLASRNASIARQNATAATEAGEYAGEVSNLRYGALRGEERAAAGASGIDVNVGSPVAVRQSTANLGAMDAAMIHYNAARQAYGDQAIAASDIAQSKADKDAALGSLAVGAFKTGSSLLSTASSLGSRFAQNQLAFGGN
jgi:hypothetical protein